MEDFTSRLDNKHISLYTNDADNIENENPVATIEWYWDVEIRSWGIKSQTVNVGEVTVEYDRTNIDTGATEPVTLKFDEVEVEAPQDWASAIYPHNVTIDNNKCTVEF